MNETGISTIASFSVLIFLKVLGENKHANSKKLVQIIAGSQLVLTAFNSLNAFIYKLALEWGITPDFTVKYSWGAPACSMFNVSGVSSYCKTEIKESYCTVLSGGLEYHVGNMLMCGKKAKIELVFQVKWPQLFKLLCQHILFTL